MASFSAVFRCLSAWLLVMVPLSGLGFEHGDWHLVCDNTLTCRAAGYLAEESDNNVSVQLTRKAGPSQPVTARLKLWEETLLWPKWLRLRINGRDFGKLPGMDKVGEEEGNGVVFNLSETQVRSLLSALPRKSEILFLDNDGRKWKLSDVGAAAVLLKMDEFQGRVGTPGALIRKGNRDEASVFPAVPEPVVRIPAFAAPQAGDAEIAKDPALRAALLASDTSQLPEDDLYEGHCVRLEESSDKESDESPLEIIRIDKDRLLVSAFCWLAAYNSGHGFWIVNDKPPYQAKMVHSSASGFENGQLFMSQKARGVGDCWWFATWSWNGERFVKTSEKATDLCRGFPGGAWSMPLIVTDIKRAE